MAYGILVCGYTALVDALVTTLALALDLSLGATDLSPHFQHLDRPCIIWAGVPKWTGALYARACSMLGHAVLRPWTEPLLHCHINCLEMLAAWIWLFFFFLAVDLGKGYSSSFI